LSSLIATVYVFSSLRRLAAIGMFAFDVSSWFLHPLQICMNAPGHESLVFKPKWCHGYIGDYPLLARFMIWRCLGTRWKSSPRYVLVQLENKVDAAFGSAMRCTFNSWMILLMGSTVVL
jgi:hypothetical protein